MVAYHDEWGGINATPDDKLYNTLVEVWASVRDIAADKMKSMAA